MSNASRTEDIASRRSTVARISSSEPTCEELHKRSSCDEIAAERARDNDSALYSDATFGTNVSRNVGLGTWALWPTNLSSWTALSGHALKDMSGYNAQMPSECFEAMGSLNGGVSKEKLLQPKSSARKMQSRRWPALCNNSGREIPNAKRENRMFSEASKLTIL